MIELDIKKTLDQFELEVKTTIKEGEFVALSGESGSGKTTLLRILAGLEKSQSFINVEGVLWQDEKSFLSPQKREIGYVFQDYALFENMSVLENLLYVQKDKKLAKYLLDITSLYELKDRSSKRLSGGQKQRVSLCRALMKRPKLLLMDEALSALDMQMRVKLQDEISKLHKEFKTTTIMVSHDKSEIYRLSDRVLVLKDGKLIEDGKVEQTLVSSFKAKVLDIKRVEDNMVVIISMGEQISKITISLKDAKNIQVGEEVTLDIKNLTPIITS